MSTVKFDQWKSSDGTEEYHKCKAWAYIYTYGVPAVLGGKGVSSITDIAVGHYKIHLTKAMDTAFYGIMTNAAYNAGASSDHSGDKAPTTLDYRVAVMLNSTGVAVDAYYLTTAVFE